VNVSRFFASSGVRLAIVQALVLITVFWVAGSLTRFSVKYIYRQEVQTRILGEVASLTALYRDKGLDYVVTAIAHDERRPGGLEYRLIAADGRPISGDLPATGAGPGWTYLDWDDAHEPGRPFQDILIYTARLPDRSILTVGQDLSEESKLRHALRRTLFWCGAAGAGIGLALSYLFARGPLHRVSAVVAAARAVSAGRMEMRAPARKALLPDDIDELGASFNTMLDEIATLVSRVRWVSTDIAHDLRTPLTHVRQKLERIKGEARLSASGAAAIQDIEADVEGLLRTFDAMLRLAEIENDPAAVNPRAVDMAELAGRIASAYGLDVEASGRRLEVALEPAEVEGDPDLIGQALANLIENALRHTPPGSTIRVAIGAGGDSAVLLSVADDGPGIPEDQREAVLQRFYRVETSRTTPGSGLGLPIIAAIAKRHGAIFMLKDADPGLKATLTFRSAPARR
jgi:signal transduction histidine kinase